MHEPLLIGISYPYLSFSPWQLCRTPRLLELAEQLHAVWKTYGKSERHLLWELRHFQERVANLPEKLAREMLFSRSGYKIQNSGPGKQRRGTMDKEERLAKVLV